MPTGSGPGSGGPTPCADRLAAAQARVDAIVQEWDALGPEVSRLEQLVFAANAELARLAGTTPGGESGRLSGTQLEQIAAQADSGSSGGADTEPSTERPPSTSTTPQVALTIRATSLKDRLARLEAKA